MIKNINARTGRICVGNAQNPESASLDGTNLYAYAYDAVGNRVSATETTNSWAYTANALNQYTSIIGNNDGTFIPEYDDDGHQKSAKPETRPTGDRDFIAVQQGRSGERHPATRRQLHQTLVKTETGVWRVAYNGENRPVTWSNGVTAIEMSYDDTGRRRAKRVSYSGAEVLHTFLYDGYLLIAESAVSNGVPLTPVNYVWDPAENTATLALCSISGTNVLFHTHNLTKNVWELLDAGGNIIVRNNYSPCGILPTEYTEKATNMFLWSSEYYDTCLAITSYAYRNLNHMCARWISRDPLRSRNDMLPYCFSENKYLTKSDFLGLTIVPDRQCSPSMKKMLLDADKKISAMSKDAPSRKKLLCCLEASGIKGNIARELMARSRENSISVKVMCTDCIVNDCGFVCNQNNQLPSNQCKVKGIVQDTIYVCNGNLGAPGKKCSPACTVFHEMVHQIANISTEEVPYKAEKCVSGCENER